MHVCQANLIDALVNFNIMLLFINVTSTEATVISIILILIIAFTIISIIKRETEFTCLLWIIFVILIPILGSLIYLIKVVLKSNKNSIIN